MSSYRVGLSSSDSNRLKATNGLKTLKSTVVAKNSVVSSNDGQENRKPSLPALSIAQFEGPICASSSPLTADQATQDVIKSDQSTATTLSLPAVAVPVAVPGETLEEAQQSEEYWRQLHEAMEVSLGEATDSHGDAVSLLEHRTQRLNDSMHRLEELHEIVEEMGLDADVLADLDMDDGALEYTGAIYRKVYEEDDD